MKVGECARYFLKFCCSLLMGLLLYGCSSSYGGGSPTSPPSIKSLTPNSGAVGTSVAITGTNFGTAQGTSTVLFGSSAATATSWSAANIVVTVPTGAVSGNVVVSVGGMASNGMPFTVTSSAPNISGLSPNSGSTGTSVTIAGTNFGATAGSVNFGTSTATVLRLEQPLRSVELWNSTGSGDTAGNAVKFTAPTIANGKVYIGTRGGDTTQGSGSPLGEIDV